MFGGVGKNDIRNSQKTLVEKFLNHRGTNLDLFNLLKKTCLKTTKISFMFNSISQPKLTEERDTGLQFCEGTLKNTLIDRLDFVLTVCRNIR